MKKLLLISLLLLGIQFIGKAQFTPDTDTLKHVPYICQADSFTVTVSGLHYMGGSKLDSASHVFRNDSLLINIYYSWKGGGAVLTGFRLPLRFGTPQPALYTIYSKRYTNGYFGGQGTSSIGVCTAVAGVNQKLEDREQLKIHPNPTQNVLNIEIPENALTLTAELSDLTGKLLLKQIFKTSEAKQLNLENLKPGIYLLQLETEKGKTVRKVVKN